MQQITFFNKALRQLDDHLFELPHLCRLLMHSLFKHCDFKTGRITDITMEQMQRDLYVAPASGRKRQKVTKDTIRCAFRTIEKFKPDDFIFSMEKQRIVIELPFIRDLFADFDAQNKEATVKAGEGEVEKVQASPCDSSEITMPSTAAKFADLTSTPEIQTPVKNINNKNKIITNNNHNQFQARLKPIAADFVPAPETIAKALALGYSDAGDLEDIQAFIRYNQRIGSRFADYNLIYLRWLSRTAIKADFKPSAETIERAMAAGYTHAADREEITAFIDYNQARGSRHKDYNALYFHWLARGCLHHQQHSFQKQQAVLSQGQSRRRGHAITKHRSYDEAVAAVAAAYPNPRSPSERLAAERQACCLVNY